MYLCSSIKASPFAGRKIARTLKYCELLHCKACYHANPLVLLILHCSAATIAVVKITNASAKYLCKLLFVVNTQACPREGFEPVDRHIPTLFPFHVGGKTRMSVPMLNHARFLHRGDEEKASKKISVFMHQGRRGKLQVGVFRSERIEEYKESY